MQDENDIRYPNEADQTPDESADVAQTGSLAEGAQAGDSAAQPDAGASQAGGWQGSYGYGGFYPGPQQGSAWSSQTGQQPTGSQEQAGGPTGAYNYGAPQQDAYSQPNPYNAAGTQQGAGDPYGGNVQYKWNYDDYQKALQNSQPHAQAEKKEKKRGHGKRAAAIAMGTIAAVVVVAFAGVGVYTMATGSAPSLFSQQGSAATDSSGAKAINPNGPTLNISSSPSTTTQTSAAGGVMTVPQAAAKISSSVVGVLQYTLSDASGPSGEGSGIVMSITDGYIYVITNNHVVEGADRYSIMLADKSEYEADLVGTDARTDLAVLKIKYTDQKVTAATFGDSDKLAVGDSVLAIGNPGGEELALTVTQGIVSALNRQITISNYSMTYIQTDASINPGNSGGALVNLYGQVVGINSAKVSETGYEGIGFAIPINNAKPIVDSLIKYGYVQGRVKLGITCQVVSSYQAKIYNIPQGLLVASVDSSSDAAAQGVRKNDILVKVDGAEITSFDVLLKAEEKYKPGDTITLTVARSQSGGTIKTFDVKIKLMEDRGTSTSTDDSTNQQNQQGKTDQSGNGFFNMP